MNIKEIKIFLGEDWEKVNGLIRSSLETDIDLLTRTNGMILSNSGKQLRPMLSLLVARACSGGKTTPDTIRFAAAAELLHNATLLHDDVADCSDERRGKPTVMSILGGPASVLIGDFWLVRAMENILASDARGNEVIRLFAKTLSDLAQGEMLQLQKADSGDTDFDDYFRIIYSKTASLFEAAATSAAISVDAPQEYLEAVREYSVALGVAFQIRDDMFDYSSSEAAIGKPVGIDLEEQKITFPLLGALASASEEEAAEIRSRVTKVHDDPSLKEGIRKFVLEHEGLEYAAAGLDRQVAKAVSALGALPDSEEKEMLAAIARYTAERNK